LGAVGAVDNIEATVAEAAQYVVNPSITLGAMDFFPKAGSALQSTPIDLATANADADYDRDFNGTQKDFTYRGAYQGEGTNPGWALQDGKKPLSGSAGTGGTSGTGGNAGSSAGGSGGASNGGN